MDELKKLLREEKAKNSKRIPYFFSAYRQLPGKFCLGYQPESKPRIEYVTVTSDGFRYRNRVHGSVNGLIKWFKEHFLDPVPRPVQTSATSGSHIPSHITRNLDYSQLQAAVDSASQHSVTGGTPYTPTHMPYGTPTPQYGGQQQYGNFGGQQRGNTYQRTQGYMGQYGRGGGGGPGGSWRSGGGWGSHNSQTPSHQTPGRTPAYTPTQTPHSVSSLYGTPPPPAGGRGQYGGGMTPQNRHPPGTPLRDE